MGNSLKNSSLTDELLYDYTLLTFLSKAEIIHIYKKFRQINFTEINNNIKYRVTFSDIQQHFPVLKYNPFADRLCTVFSSKNDNCFSFEDMINLCSVFSKNCSVEVKTLWAFKIFDFNQDCQICKDDIYEIIRRLTEYSDPSNKIEEHEKEKIGNVLLEEMDLQHTGSIGQLEFQHAISKMPEFPYSFSFNI